ncbi:MAG: tRNA (adenosine(37)-N6)-threonylcarbamoyltransferase complex dimerization subunit type 1 TsaB [Solirubrobacterales bacterium]|nr:tRNA (adenosine(37)-N6)-threonylcarbamoyltransferase complex dimerization subunit type 1 TsaB [Solirubrobacterales bacterium]
MTVVLGLDGSTADAAVAVTRELEVVREELIGPGDAGRPRHSEALLPAVERCVEEAGGWEGVDRIAVGAGPGSFTGLRIAIATARALAQARALPLVAPSSLAVLARGIAEGREGSAPLLPVVDARRGELFAALYEPAGSELWPPLVAAPERLAERLRGLEPAPLAAGDGALRFREQLEAAAVTVLPEGDPAHRIAARHVCGLGEAMAPGAPAEVEPTYLRAPDAEKWLERDR